MPKRMVSKYTYGFWFIYETNWYVESIWKAFRKDPKAFRKDVISVEKRLALVLYYLKDQCCLRVTANKFGVLISTVSLSLRMVCNAVTEHLDPLYIKFPSTWPTIHDETLNILRTKRTFKIK